jgi:hypothetical protein
MLLRNLHYKFYIIPTHVLDYNYIVMFEYFSVRYVKNTYT